MIRVPSFLVKNRYNTYFYNKNVPKSLVAAVGKSRIRISLKTREKSIAVPLARALSLRVDFLFHRIKLGELMGKNLTSQKIAEELRLLREEMKRSNDLKQQEMAPSLFSNVQIDFDALRASIPNAYHTISSSQNPTDTNTLQQQIIDDDPSLLNNLLEQFIKTKTRGRTQRWTAGTQEKRRREFALFIRVLTEIEEIHPTIDNISEKSAEIWIETLLEMPKNYSKGEYKGKTIAQLIKTKNEDKMDETTINQYVDFIKSFFDWTIRTKKCDFTVNYFEDLRQKEEEGDDEEWDAFEIEDMKKIFSTKIYTDNNWLHPYYYWLPLLSLYTGARTGELTQLRVYDIKKENGINVFDITKEKEEHDTDKDKTLKNPSSKRKIPIHDKLIELGFIDFVNKIRTTKHVRIFHELRAFQEGYRKFASDWFNERYICQCGIGVWVGKGKKRKCTKDRKLSFKSFRHTFQTQMRNLQVDEGYIDSMVGHKETTGQRSRYRGKHIPNLLKPELDKLQFDLPMVKKFDLRRVDGHLQRIEKKLERAQDKSLGK